MDHYQVIENALIYIEDNLNQPLSLESVAKTFNMSKYYFHRLFSAIMGCSLNQYTPIQTVKCLPYIHSR